MVGPHCLRLIDTAWLKPGSGGDRSVSAWTRRGNASRKRISCFSSWTPPAPPLATPRRCKIAIARSTDARHNTVVALNKIDLVGDRPIASIPPGLDGVPVSALTGAGLEDLTAAIIRRADRFQPMVGAGFGRDQCAPRATRSTRAGPQGLRLALEKLSTAGSGAELLASDLRGALDAFGEISGKIDNERDARSAFCRLLHRQMNGGSVPREGNPPAPPAITAAFSGRR